MIWWQILLGGVFLGTLNRLLLAVGRLRGRRIRRAATGRYSVAIWVSNRLYRVDWASPETIGVWVGDLFAQGELDPIEPVGCNYYRFEVAKVDRP